MAKKHFEVATDHEGKRYIFQKIKEHDKNHRESDTMPNSQARIYKIEGSFSFHHVSNL